MWKEFAGIMVENEKLMNRDSCFKNAKYIIVIKEEQADDNDENWEGLVGEMHQVINDMCEAHLHFSKQVENNVNKCLKNHADQIASDIEKKLAAKINLLIWKLDMAITIFDDNGATPWVLNNELKDMEEPKSSLTPYNPGDFAL